MTNLDKAARKALRQRAHALKPVIRLGQHGLTDAVLAELDIALAHHELVKVKLAADDDGARGTQLQGLLDGSRSTLVQRIGHTATLYRQRPPAARASARRPAARRTGDRARQGARGDGGGSRRDSTAGNRRR